MFFSALRRGIPMKKRRRYAPVFSADDDKFSKFYFITDRKPTQAKTKILLKILREKGGFRTEGRERSPRRNKRKKSFSKDKDFAKSPCHPAGACGIIDLKPQCRKAGRRLRRGSEAFFADRVRRAAENRDFFDGKAVCPSVERGMEEKKRTGAGKQAGAGVGG